MYSARQAGIYCAISWKSNAGLSFEESFSLQNGNFVGLFVFSLHARTVIVFGYYVCERMFDLE